MHRVDLPAPARKKKRAVTQDGRALRRYQRPWKIDRVFAWLQNILRLATRYEWYPQIYRAFVHVGIIMLPLKRF